MSKESYIRGFCKAAEAAGVDPKALAKFAGQYEGEPLKEPSNTDFKNLAEVSDKTNTNPSLQDLMALSSISPEVLRGDLKGMTVGDYLTTMYGVNPDATTQIVGMARNANGPAFSNMVSRKLSDYSDARRKLSTPYWMATTPAMNYIKPLAKLNYATATNMLDHIGKKTGRPIWDVEKARPTPYGLGISVK